MRAQCGVCERAALVGKLANASQQQLQPSLPGAAMAHHLPQPPGGLGRASAGRLAADSAPEGTNPTHRLCWAPEQAADLLVAAVRAQSRLRRLAWPMRYALPLRGPPCRRTGHRRTGTSLPSAYWLRRTSCLQRCLPIAMPSNATVHPSCAPVERRHKIASMHKELEDKVQVQS